MAQVTVMINGRQYRMACEDGQEEHLEQLAKDIEDRIEQLRGSFGQVGDQRLTVMAALTVADELTEARRRLGRIEDEITALQEARTQATNRTQQTQEAIVAALHAAAERIETITKKLNQTVGNGSITIGG